MMLGLGVGIDYALFILARHRQNLDDGMPVPEAVGRANATAGLSVLFAGVTVVVAIAGLQVSGIPMMTMMGWASALMVAVTMLAAVTLLPALLGLVGTRVNSLRVPVHQAEAGATTRRSKSARWAARVVAKPGPLRRRRGGRARRARRPGLRHAPRLRRRRQRRPVHDHPQGLRPDRRRLRSRRQRAAAGRRRARRLAGTTRPRSAGSTQALAADAGRRLGRRARRSAPRRTSRSSASRRPRHRRTRRPSQLVERLRDDVLPDASATPRVDAMVTGGPPMPGDISDQLQQRMPWFLGAVIGLSFLVLMLVFRSVLVPLKAALLNLLSVGAAYGVLVAVFQWGWGAEPDRRARDGADHAAGADADVRDPVRAVDGLRGLPARAGCASSTSPPRPEARRRRGRRLHRPGHHQRGTDHDQRLRAPSS